MSSTDVHSSEFDSLEESSMSGTDRRFGQERKPYDAPGYTDVLALGDDAVVRIRCLWAESPGQPVREGWNRFSIVVELRRGFNFRRLTPMLTPEAGWSQAQSDPATGDGKWRFGISVHRHEVGTALIQAASSFKRGLVLSPAMVEMVIRSAEAAQIIETQNRPPFAGGARY